MATLRQKKQATLAEAAGLTTPVDTSPKFTWTVSGNLGPYKIDEVLSTKEHIVKYWRMVINEGADKETNLTDDQIWTAIQTINTEGLEPDDADMAAISYFDTLQSTREEPLDDKTRQKILSESQIAAEAVMLGGLADKAFTASVQKALDGKQDWDGGPITIEAQLVRLYGDRMHDWPMIGTRKTGQTNRKGETRDNVDAGYNLPTDYFKVMVDGEPKVIRWLNTFVEAMPHVHQLVTRRKTVVDLEKGTNLALIPEEYAHLVPPKNSFINSVKLNGLKDDFSAQITRNINRIGIAIAFWQTQQAIKEKLSDLIKFSLVDGTAEASAKRTKPIQMAGRNKKDEDFTAGGRPISLSAFIRYGRFVDECKAQGGQLNKLQDLDKQSRKRKPLTPAVGAASTVVESKIENVEAFKTVLTNVFTYAETHEGMIKSNLADPRKGKEMAYWIRQACLTLQPLWDNPAVIKLAAAYDQEQMNASAAQAEAEAKTGLPVVQRIA